ncbi:MAG: HAMP domain-containing sensor histidine kinase [Bacteroidales bacterium]|jgi:signal transduction histidine kinase
MDETKYDSNNSSEREKIEDQLKDARKQIEECEKMATLGQLTAGIAHEIKNPLNFIKNFSELTLELIQELNGELGKLAKSMDQKEVEYLKGILADMSGNIMKISEHGKRAESIIRGMLLYAHGKSGEHVPTDINAMLTEFVSLGYQGMRASDNTFNIKIEHDHDLSIGMISVVQQDIGRVFLNLINNACYATHQKKKEHPDDYSPLLKTSTRNLGDQVEIRIRDNGNGIPPSLTEKIFDPFFTTKPAGSGTGLGLSISYDIIVNQHHGEIKVETIEGEFAEFIIRLPKTKDII